MRNFAFVLAAFGALVQPVFAETAWEKIEHGIDIVKECAGDVRQHCKDVKPGDGRIKACMTEHLADLSGACVQALGEPKPAVSPAASLADPCEVKGDRNWRGNAFYEILFMNHDANGPGGLGNYYNSIGNNFDASNEVMDARFLALDAEKLKKEYGSGGVRFNGPRRFVANGFSGIAFDGCKKRVIGGIPFSLYGTFAAPSFDAFMTGKETPYHVLVSKRTNTFYFNAGEQVHELVTPEGEVYTMFSLSLRVDPKNTIENLPTLGQRLTLPAGWTYRVRTLDKDLALSSSYDANPPNTIVLDQFEGNYQHNPGQK